MNKPPKKMVDMHIHSYYSDGLISPENLVNLAREKNVALISITDHNSVEAYKRFDWQNAGVKIISGCEFSVNYHGKRMHILGYNFDVNDKAINQYLNSIREIQLKKLEIYLEFFKEHDVFIPAEILKNIYENGYSASDAGFTSMLDLYHVQYPENKFFDLKKKTGARIPFEEVTPQFVIDLIHNAGGKAVLAHPGKYNLGDPFDVLYDLKDEGLDGVECFHPTHNEYLSRFFRGMANDFGLFVTAGSDAHTYYLKKANKRPFAGESKKTKLDMAKVLTIMER